jgi:hypothetical protein
MRQDGEMAAFQKSENYISTAESYRHKGYPESKHWLNNSKYLYVCVCEGGGGLVMCVCDFFKMAVSSYLKTIMKVQNFSELGVKQWCGS